MLETIEEWCRQRGIQELRLSSGIENELATMMWRVSGFETVSCGMSKSLG